MNSSTKDIAKLLNCNLQTALKVQDKIDEDWLIDWSEDSEKKINKVVLEVAKELSII